MNEINPKVERPVIENMRTKEKKIENVQSNTYDAEKLEKEKVSFKNKNCISEFKSLIKERPYFIYVIYHRCLYKDQLLYLYSIITVLLQISWYSLLDFMVMVFTHIKLAIVKSR